VDVEHGLALVAHHADPLVAALLLLLHLRPKRIRETEQDQLQWGFLRRGSAAAAAQVAHLHGGALHALEGEEESRLHGGGRFSSGEEMASRKPGRERFQFGGGGLENSCGFTIEWGEENCIIGRDFWNSFVSFFFWQN